MRKDYWDYSGYKAGGLGADNTDWGRRLSCVGRSEVDERSFFEIVADAAKRHVGDISLFAGWVFAFVMVLILNNPDSNAGAFEIGLIAAALFGFGIGWNMRDERGE